MTTGQKLVELSGLASGSALAHLLAVTQGGGTGPAKTVFAAQMTVCAESDAVTLVQQQRDVAVNATAEKTTLAQSKKPDRIDVLKTPARMEITERRAMLYVVHRKDSVAFVRTLPNTITSRRKRVIQST